MCLFSSRSCSELSPAPGTARPVRAIPSGPFVPFGAVPALPVPAAPFSLPCPVLHPSRMPSSPPSSSPSPSLSQCPMWGRAVVPAVPRVPRRRKRCILEIVAFPPKQAPAVGQDPQLGLGMRSCSRRAASAGLGWRHCLGTFSLFGLVWVWFFVIHKLQYFTF